MTLLFEKRIKKILKLYLLITTNYLIEIVIHRWKKYWKYLRHVIFKAP